MVLDEAHELPMGVGRKGKTGIDDISPIQATFRCEPSYTRILPRRLTGYGTLLLSSWVGPPLACRGHRWYITGSPFPHGRTSLHNALDLLRIKVKKPIDPDQKKKDKTPIEKVCVNPLFSAHGFPFIATRVIANCSATQNEEEGLGIQNLRYGVTYMPSVELVRFRRNPPVHSCVGGRLTIAGPYYPFGRR